ncbi:nucleoside diphosphate kinase regulator [Phenylobacterium zucineum]|nr:nucleoside diphosphate kinase regulator [Phenylobacterium zucineum]
METKTMLADTKTRERARTPTVRVAEADYDRLLNLADHDGPGAELLARELDRAIVVREGEKSRPFVRLGSTVEYRDRLTEKVRTVELVPPDAADIDANRLSVLSPVGAALLGLSVGDTFSWTAPDGRPRVVTVEAVRRD